MVNLGLSAQIPAGLQSEQMVGTHWPTIEESLSPSKGSNPSKELNGSAGMEKIGNKEDPDLTKLKKNQEVASPDELPSNQKQMGNQSYSAAVGVGNVDIPMVLDEVDGEKIGIIPKDIITEMKPLWTDLLVGKFPSKAPSLKQIFFTVNKIRTLGNRNIKIEVFQVSDTLIKFRIPDKNTRDRILRRGMWSIEGLPMILSKWAPIEELEELEVKVVPIWITIKKVPRAMFHWKGLSYIAKVVGKPKRLHPETIQCIKFDEAKVLVEADINAQMPLNHKFKLPSRETFNVEFLYPWVPKRCNRCFKWGHNADICSDQESKGPEKEVNKVDKPLKEGSQKEDSNLDSVNVSDVETTSASLYCSLEERNTDEEINQAVQEKNVKDTQMEQKEIIQANKDGNNLETEQSLGVRATSESPSSLLMKRNIDGNSSIALREELTGSKFIGIENQGKSGDKGSMNSNQKEGSYIKANSKKIITTEDALEELRKVKEGLRQVSPSISLQKQNQNRKNQVESQNSADSQGNKVNSNNGNPVTYFKE